MRDRLVYNLNLDPVVMVRRVLSTDLSNSVENIVDGSGRSATEDIGYATPHAD